jgi:hypothetical protein
VKGPPAGGDRGHLPRLAGLLGEQLGRDEGGLGALGAAAALQPEHVDLLELEALRVRLRDHLHRLGRGRLVAAAQLDPGVGDRAQVADEVAGRALRLAPGPGPGG